MSTATVSPTLDLGGIPATPMPRLIKVELRKMADTRASRWLLISTALASAVVMVGMLLYGVSGDSNAITANGFVRGMSIPIGILLPVIAIMAITSEWSQRTGLATFTLEPHRMRIVVAKLAAVGIMAIGALLTALILGVVGNLLYGALTGREVVWNVGGAQLGGMLLIHLLGLMMGFGLGLLLLNTPAAISVYFVVSIVLPMMVYQLLIGLTSWGEKVVPWIDMFYATAPVTAGDASGIDWARTAVTTLIWVVVPIALGCWRVSRAEIK